MKKREGKKKGKREQKRGPGQTPRGRPWVTAVAVVDCCVVFGGGGERRRGLLAFKTQKQKMYA
jgi:hypothetical protein